MIRIDKLMMMIMGDNDDNDRAYELRTVQYSVPASTPQPTMLIYSRQGGWMSCFITTVSTNLVVGDGKLFFLQCNPVSRRVLASG